MTPTNDAIMLDLLAIANDDGGWGAYADRPSNTEATALALMALSRMRDTPAAVLGGAASWLRATQRADGSWPFTRNDAAESWSGALAVLALAGSADHADAVGRGAAWLTETEGQALPWRARLDYWLNPEGQVTELDPGVNGWSWTADAFSWVEPTVWAILALEAAGGRTLGRRARTRLADGRDMLLDRACYGGGWNYGSKRILGADIDPFPDTTALALLALRGGATRFDDDRVDLDAQLARLDQLLDAHASGLSLALAALCRRAYDRADDALRLRLERRFEETRFLGETRSLALAALALDSEARHPFRSRA